MYQELIEEFAAVCQAILANQLTGVYLHGSMAMGCFNADKSDLDIIVVVENRITDAQKMRLMEQIIRLNQRAPAKGLEVSFVRREYCKPFLYPTPFELHFSPAHLQWFQDDPQDYVEKMQGTDKDLAAHFTVLNQYGIKIYGKEISEVFNTVPQKDYIDSIWCDIKNAQEDIWDDPVYVILNLCRVLAYLKDNRILSKEEGGKWALLHLGRKYQSLIAQATDRDCSHQTMQADKRLAKQFASMMLKEIKLEMETYR
ncbi:MAG TPA: DUF4111 domain-containing protein [Candidatus Faecousia intestinigallinarum]|nr:DUF4111 domain-containing protein [Candidatus Faecousia intestinigallinarum]